jgi:hypothetical protein
MSVDRSEYTGTLYAELVENNLPVVAVAYDRINDTYVVEFSRALTGPEQSLAQSIRAKFSQSNLNRRKDFFIRYNYQRIILAILEKMDTGTSVDFDKIQVARRLL